MSEYVLHAAKEAIMQFDLLYAFRLATFAALAFGVSACGAKASKTCDPGASSAIVSPRDGELATGTTRVVIAVQAKSDMLGTKWSLILKDDFGNRVDPELDLIEGSSLYHPFPDTDYFYAADVFGLPSGREWRVFLNEPSSSCTARYLATFTNVQ
jgi:hypothetical protein